MVNFQEIWDKIKDPDPIEKLRGVGDLLQYAIPLGALFAIAVMSAPLAIMWAKVVLVTAGITHGMKLLFNKTKLGKRPDGHEMSFPSGHTSGAFAGAWFIFFAWGPVAAVVPLVLASVVAVSRVLAKKHWIRDVVVGGLLALGVAAYFFGVL